MGDYIGQRPGRNGGDFDSDIFTEDDDLFEAGERYRRKSRLEEYMSLYDNSSAGDRSSYGMDSSRDIERSVDRRVRGEYIGSRRPAEPSRQSVAARNVVARANKSETANVKRAYSIPTSKEREREREERMKQQTRKKRFRGLKYYLTDVGGKFVLIGLLLVAAIFVFYYSIAGMFLSDMEHVEVDTKFADAPVYEVASMDLIEARYVRSILLLGIDDDGSAGSRSDTIMIASINTRQNQIKLCSILRDTYVEIPRNGSHKINAAYAYGGASLTMETIQNNFRIRLTDYISVDMEDMIHIVDALGGVDIEISAKEAEQINMHSQSPNTVTAGLQHLDGMQAVCFAQIRKIDSDFQRTERQRKLLNAILEKCRGMSKFRLMGFARKVCPYLTTNMSNRELASLGLKALPAMKNGIHEMHIPADGTSNGKMINGSSVVVANIGLNANKLHDFLLIEEKPAPKDEAQEQQ